MAWLSTLVSNLITRAVSWAAGFLMEKYRAHEKKKERETAINKRLQVLKEAYKKSFDGKPVTPEQREELKNAIQNFIKSNSSNGL